MLSVVICVLEALASENSQPPPTKVHRLAIDLWQTANDLKKDNRIRKIFNRTIFYQLVSAGLDYAVNRRFVPETWNPAATLPFGNLWSLNIRPLKRPLSVKMVFPAARAVKKLMGPQFEHTSPADKELLAVGKYLWPSFGFLTTDHTVHEGQPYLNQLYSSNPLTMNWQEIARRKS